jgi:hypothetical protein
MNRLSTFILIGLAGLMASCGSSVSSSTQAQPNYEYSVVMSADILTLNSGDWGTVTATVEETFRNGAPKAVTPQPTIKFYSSDSGVTVSPAGEVCAGQWDTRYLTCTSTGTLTPAGTYVTITAYNASHNVSGTTRVSVHNRAASMSLNSPAWTAKTDSTGNPVKCILQGNSVKYLAAPVDSSGNAITNVNENDYEWVVSDSTVASVGAYGDVVAVAPGVTNVYANLNGTVSAPLAFVTCPPTSILFESSPFTNGTPILSAGTTADLSLNKGDQKYLSAVLSTTDGVTSQNLSAATLNYTSSDPLAGSFTSVLALTDKLAANTSGRFSMIASCAPTTCNNSVGDFTSPAGSFTGKDLGFGYPIYSNVIGATVAGSTGSTVLITGTTFADGTTPIYRMIAYDSESMEITQTVELANLPNSLVVAPNGATAYVGSSSGLVVVNLSTYASTLQTYPIVGGISTDVITGKVLGVSPDSRYVVVSDTTIGEVFLIDTTGTKTAVRQLIPGINTVAFAADDINFWIGGTYGVYKYAADAFVQTLTNASSNVAALAWMPDGQSYFASGAQLTNYSTCDDGYQTPPLPAKVQSLALSPINLATTAINGVPYATGLSGNNEWVTVSSAKSPATAGNVCMGSISLGTPAITPVSPALSCTATQVTFSPNLEEEFVTGVDSTCGTSESVIHGYNASTQAIVDLTLNSSIFPLSGGVLNDGRKLYVGSWDSTAKTATLHRIALLTSTGTQDTLTEDASASVELVPSFVAVVPK